MIFSAAGLKLLGEQESRAVDALFLWLTLHEPRLILEKYREAFSDRITVQDLENVRAMPKADFFEAYLRASTNLAIHGLP
jgi:hypothetical protein